MIRAEQLNVVSVISNPTRVQARPRLTRGAMQHQAQSGVTQWLVEAVFGDRDPEVANIGDPHHIIVRCDHEVWLKENLINLAVARFPADWKYVMWADADFEFVRPDWATEVVQALQHWKVVQPFSNAIDLGPDFEIIQTHTGFAYNYNRGLQPFAQYTPHFHPGYCWAWRREAWDAVGGLIEKAVCGAGDHHMALGLIGQPKLSLPGGLHPNYIKMVTDWTQRAEVAIERDIGHVAGTIIHHFHGFKENRNYEGRWQILQKTQFDPEVDLQKDAHGVLQLAPGRTYLRDKLRAYFRQRLEDAGPRQWPVAAPPKPYTT